MPSRNALLISPIELEPIMYVGTLINYSIGDFKFGLMSLNIISILIYYPRVTD